MKELVKQHPSKLSLGFTLFLTLFMSLYKDYIEKFIQVENDQTVQLLIISYPVSLIQDCYCHNPISTSTQC